MGMIKSWTLTTIAVLLGIFCYQIGGGTKHLVLSALVVLTGIISTYISYKKGNIKW